MKGLTFLLAILVAHSVAVGQAPLKQSTAVTVKLGPFVDDSDGVTAETALTISQADVRISKAGGDYAQKNEASAATHDELGEYDVDLDATDTATLGRLRVMVQESGALPVWRDFVVMPANVYDSIYGADKLQVDAVEVSGDGTAADNAEAAFTGTITSFDGLDTAQDLQHAATQAGIGTPGDLGGGGSLAANLLDLAGATFSSATDSNEAIRNRGDAAWLSAALDAADVWGYSGGAGRTLSGTINTLDALDAAQDTQHGTTQGLITTVDTAVDAIKAVTDLLPDAGALTELAGFASDSKDAAEAVEAKLPAGGKVIAAAGDTNLDLDDIEGGGGGGGSTSPVLQFDVSDAFTWEIPGRGDGPIVAKNTLRMSSQLERPRIAFDTRWITKARPSTVTNVEVLDDEGAASASLVVADEEDTTNCGVRNHLVMSKVTGCSEAGTYTVRVTFTTADGATLIVSGEIVAP